MLSLRVACKGNKNGDTVGGDVAQKSFAVLKPGGRAAFIAALDETAE
jgi:NADPH:quinone reductase-like Zn-dependent oxidoreductase